MTSLGSLSDRRFPSRQPMVPSLLLLALGGAAATGSVASVLTHSASLGALIAIGTAGGIVMARLIIVG